MKRFGIVTVLCLLTAVVGNNVVAQMEERFEPRPRPEQMAGRRRKQMGSKGFGKGVEAMIARFVNNPEIAEEIGLTEEQVKTLREGMEDLKNKAKDLRAEMKKAAMEQAKLMTESAVDEEAVMEAVEKTGQIRTEIAKLQIKQLLLVKNTLTREQIEQTRQRMRERMKKRFERRGERDHRGDDIGGERTERRMRRETEE